MQLRRLRHKSDEEKYKNQLKTSQFTFLVSHMNNKTHRITRSDTLVLDFFSASFVRSFIFFYYSYFLFSYTHYHLVILHQYSILMCWCSALISVPCTETWDCAICVFIVFIFMYHRSNRSVWYLFICIYLYVAQLSYLCCVVVVVQMCFLSFIMATACFSTWSPREISLRGQ